MQFGDTADWEICATKNFVVRPAMKRERGSRKRWGIEPSDFLLPPCAHRTHFGIMNFKHQKNAALIASFVGREWPPHYLAFFECFNGGLFYQAHDVLEELWLQQRSGSNGDFYKALIQLAGAFVHLQKGRPAPALALFKLARSYLERYPVHHHGLDVACTLFCLDEWVRLTEGRSEIVPAPRLTLDRA